MKQFTSLAAALAAASCLTFGAASAQAEYAIVAPSAPPPPRVEVIPAPVQGRAWVEGHWVWRDGNYAWAPGHWQTARNDMEWVQGHWSQRDGEWAWVEGHWRDRAQARGNWRRADSDGDGVANMYDRYPRDDGRS